jgi:GntR family transcriptional regulator, N-acetylglucosamine utilization regulator
MTAMDVKSAWRPGDEAIPKLDRASPIPLYVQIKQRLLALLATWDERNTRFYGDNELCRMFEVSRMTVRQAVQELVNDGFLTRTRGSGTFVPIPKIEERFTPLMNLGDQWASRGRPMQVEVLAFEERPCPAEIAPVLDIADGEPVRYIQRLRFSGRVPIAIDHRFIPLPVAGDLAREDAVHSLLHALWNRFELSHGELRIEAATADKDVAGLLRIVPGAPLLVRHLRYYDTGERRLMAGYSLYRADLVRYSMTVPLSREADAGEEADAGGDSESQVVRLTREVASSRQDAWRRRTEEAS